VVPERGSASQQENSRGAEFDRGRLRAALAETMRSTLPEAASTGRLSTTSKCAGIM
jgi:hypothetical protein